MFYVVGSGPSGVACSYALVENGHEVTLLDVGLELEKERRHKIETLRSLPPERWKDDSKTRETLKELKKGSQTTKAEYTQRGIKKLHYGSDYPYRGADEQLNISRSGVGGSSSFAKGGFSTVWGGGISPLRNEDIDGWPISMDTLAPYYQSVLELMSVVAEDDNLSEVLPLYETGDVSLKKSKQAKFLLNRMGRNQSNLNNEGIYFGSARLAVSTDDRRCPNCGLQIFGCCPGGTVYNSSETLSVLKERDNFSYVPDVIVEEVSETENEVILTGESYSDGESLEFIGSKAFLGCGPLSTTKILLNSINMQSIEVQFKEPPYFILPMVSFNSVGNVSDETVHSLGELYIEICDDSLSERTIHLSVYTFNDRFEHELEQKLGPITKLLSPMLRRLSGRMYVVMGYLHSEHGSEISGRLRDDNELHLDGKVTSQTKKDMYRVAWKLLTNSTLTSLVPLLPGLVIKNPGESFRIGGSFPMSDTPSKTETDRLGRPAAFDRIHAVDATIFPSIPATPVTAPVMANAYRIGDTHDR